MYHSIPFLLLTPRRRVSARDAGWPSDASASAPSAHGPDGKRPFWPFCPGQPPGRPPLGAATVSSPFIAIRLLSSFPFHRSTLTMHPLLRSPLPCFPGGQGRASVERGD